VIPPDSLRVILLPLCRYVAQGDYDAAIGACVSSRLSPDDLRQVIADYRRTIVDPPPNVFEDADVIVVARTGLPAYSVRLPLWTREEGRSDLTLELTVRRVGDRWEVELEDLRVL